jgi:tripeptide aminopeptidase
MLVKSLIFSKPGFFGIFKYNQPMNLPVDTPAETVNAERLLGTFLELVRIDSPSGEEEALRDYLVRRLEAYKDNGLTHRTDTGGNLIVDVPAHGCVHAQRLVLSGHMDVVPPCRGIRPIVEAVKNAAGEEVDSIIRSDNTTVLGADDKAGLAPILEAVFHALERQLPRPALRLLFTTREEVGLAGAKELDDASLAAHFAVTLDHTGRQGVIIHQAPTYIQLEIECLGKSTHAGMAPEKGVNAMVLAARVIGRLHLGRLDADTTANIGVIHGGKADNVVPDRVVLQGELRGHDPARLEAEIAHIETVLCEESAAMPGSVCRWTHHISFEAYRLPEDHPGIRLVAAAARQSGLMPELIRTNGGSDNNIFVRRGLPGVVLSAGYVDPHALTECVSLHEMRTCARFLLNILDTFAREPF